MSRAFLKTFFLQKIDDSSGGGSQSKELEFKIFKFPQEDLQSFV